MNLEIGTKSFSGRVWTIFWMEDDRLTTALGYNNWELHKTSNDRKVTCDVQLLKFFIAFAPKKLFTLHKNPDYCSIGTVFLRQRLNTKLPLDGRNSNRKWISRRGQIRI